MSVLLSIAVFITVILVGFGLNGWSLAALILGLTVGLGFFMSLIDIVTVKEAWKDRRCELDIMLTAFLYKRSDDSRSASLLSVSFLRFQSSICPRRLVMM